MCYNDIMRYGRERIPAFVVYGGRMKHYCTVCRKIHEGKCARQIDFRRTRDSQIDKFRNTQLWRRKSAEIQERDLHCCRVCLKAGLMNSRDLSVHHIIPMSADFDRRLDNGNLITLCRFHHEQAERKRISRRELLHIAESVPTLPKL